MNTNESNPIAIALDLLLRDRPKGGQRSRVLRLSRDVLLPLCQDIVNPEIANLHLFDGLQKEIGDKCPGRDALYRFADAFMKLYRKVTGELEGSHFAPSVAALPVQDVARRLCLTVAQVQAMIDQGELHAVQLAGQVRVPLAAIQSILAEAAHAH